MARKEKGRQQEKPRRKATNKKRNETVKEKKTGRETNGVGKPERKKTKKKGNLQVRVPRRIEPRK